MDFTKDVLKFAVDYMQEKGMIKVLENISNNKLLEVIKQTNENLNNIVHELHTLEIDALKDQRDL